MEAERFGQILGAMVFALKRETTSRAELDEFLARWDVIKALIGPYSEQLDRFDEAAAAAVRGDLEPAKRLLERH